MANVFTKRTGKPKSTTLSDYGGFDPMDSLTLPRIMSPTRVGNPHPIGLEYQFNQQKSTFSIWNPDFHRIAKKMPMMLNHLRWVNFSCGPVEIRKREPGKPPDIKYSETTTSRCSYGHPSRFPHLILDQKTTRYGYTQRKSVNGTVPNMTIRGDCNRGMRTLTPESPAPLTTKPASRDTQFIESSQNENDPSHKLHTSFKSPEPPEGDFSDNSHGHILPINDQCTMNKRTARGNVDILILNGGEKIRPISPRRKYQEKRSPENGVPVAQKQIYLTPGKKQTEKPEKIKKPRIAEISRKVVIPDKLSFLVIRP